jgi:hypothetical protein
VERSTTAPAASPKRTHVFRSVQFTIFESVSTPTTSTVSAAPTRIALYPSERP